MDRLRKGKNSNRGNISKTREKKTRAKRRLCKGDATPIKREKRLRCKQIEVVPRFLLSFFLNDVQTIGSRVLDSHHLNLSGASLCTADRSSPPRTSVHSSLLFSQARRGISPVFSSKTKKRAKSGKETCKKDPVSRV